MKTFPLLALVVGLAACSQPAETNQDQSETTTVSMEFFGDSIDPSNAMDANAMMAALENKDSAIVKVEVPIEAVCQKKGCWMDVKVGDDQSMLVKFKDYGFFVPMDAAGKTAVLEGVVRVDTMNVAWLKHKAEDAGKSQEEIDAITEPEVKFSFMANGVVIK